MRWTITDVRFCNLSDGFLSVAPRWSIVRSFVYCRYRQRVIRSDNTTKLWHVSELWHILQKEKQHYVTLWCSNTISLIENTVQTVTKSRGRLGLKNSPGFCSAGGKLLENFRNLDMISCILVHLKWWKLYFQSVLSLLSKWVLLASCSSF